jgi:type VI secretion system protein ImpB
MEDFEPARVVEQVPPLKKLLEKRNELRDLMAKVDLSEDLEAKLEEVLQNTENLSRISGELGVGDKADSGDDGGEDK